MALAITAIVACGADVDGNINYQKQRARMVADQIAARGIHDPAVLEAMRTVPRHAFIPNKWQNEAYDDHPLPIGHDQTISQPYIVAYMTEALKAQKGQKILEIGTGSGYQAAVLAHMGARVFSIEIVKSLGTMARKTLKQLGYDVQVRIGDGYAGWPEEAPFDGIIVTAAPTEIPAPLIAQLKDGGRLVVPVGRYFQDLKVIKKVSGKLVTENTLPVRFVPMTGKIEN
ncbi:MAG: protein-L-isoaspartate(D-aspartate) O-methyltransferase [Proteobacteria bacterium]|nr:protein-L-isoaspartate(D-aspartate) O-methyltransferase [Pseudomonadota bacterium]